jgi:Manganese containing catalase
MFLHRKELIHPVDVDTPDPKFGTYLLEQFGGTTGALTATLQYWLQSFHVENAAMSIRPAPKRTRGPGTRSPRSKRPEQTAANIGPAVARTTSGARAAGQSR